MCVMDMDFRSGTLVAASKQGGHVSWVKLTYMTKGS
jgi:hypothetical protein